MRRIKLTGREVTIVRAIGFTDGASGAEIEEFTRMEPGDVVDTINSLMSAGFVESVPYYDQIEMAAVAETIFEVNPSYIHEIKGACRRS
ncbi:MAG: helix-turn-helix domain-containing protein [Chthoniobacterales bacterium]